MSDKIVKSMVSNATTSNQKLFGQTVSSFPSKIKLELPSSDQNNTKRSGKLDSN